MEFNNTIYPTQGTLSYIKKLDEFPPLSRKREGELAALIQKYKTGRARKVAMDELIKHNLKLVVDEAYKFARNNFSISVDDFIGAGNEGIMRAVEKFNPKKYKTKFSTYASYWIRQAMHRTVYKNACILAIPEYISNGLARKNRAENKGSAKNGGKKMTTKQLMKDLKISEKAVKKLEKAHIQTFSLDQSTSENEEADGTNFKDIILDEKAVNPGKDSLDKDDFDKLYEALEQLDDKSKEIIKARFLGDEVIRLKKLGKRFGVSHERIRQISVAALDTLRSKLTKHQ